MASPKSTALIFLKNQRGVAFHLEIPPPFSSQPGWTFRFHAFVSFSGGLGGVQFWHHEAPAFQVDKGPKKKVGASLSSNHHFFRGKLVSLKGWELMAMSPQKEGIYTSQNKYPLEHGFICNHSWTFWQGKCLTKIRKRLGFLFCDLTTDVIRHAHLLIKYIPEN